MGRMRPICPPSHFFLSPLPRLQMRPQLPHRLVFLVADALDAQRQLLTNLGHRPALEAQLQDPLLPWAELLLRRPPHRLSVFGEPLVTRGARVGGAIDG